MRLVDDFPFYEELISPVHNRSLLDAQAKPKDDEVVIDDSWTIRVAVPAPQTELAAEDLQQFLTNAMGLSVKIVDAPGAKQICLTVDEALDEDAETHAVAVKQEQITLTGASPAAVLHAVVFIEGIMSSRRAPFLPLGERRRSPLFKRRIHRSCMSPFYVEELTGDPGPPYPVATPLRPLVYPGWTHSDAGPDAFYHDNILSRLMHHGMNGIWIRGALCKLAKVSVFPEFGRNAEQIMAELRRLCERAERYGISVYLYFNEPLGLPRESEFWEKYPECKGSYARYHGRYCLCTSTQPVKDFLVEGMSYIFKQVPQLGGVILISASEFPTHCYCHIPTRPGSPPKEEFVAKGLLCERCAEREAQEVVAEVVTLIRDGVRSASPDAQVIAWNWSWSMYEEDPQEGILRRLPEDVIVMGDFERGIKTQALGFEYQHDEYSVKIVGPSDRFNKMADWEQERGREVYAKIQIGTTHEDGNVPYLPVMHRLAEKYIALAKRGVTGMMTCWNFGNMPSLATELLGMMAWSDASADPEEALRELAARNFGPGTVDAVVEGWKIISDAMEDFPSSVPVMYYGPVNRGLAFPLFLERINKPFPRSWLLDIVAEGDDLDSWTKPFGAEHVIRCFRTVADGFAKGAERMLSALPQTSGGDAEALKREAGVAQICALQFRTAANIAEFILTRNKWLDTDDADEKAQLRERIVQILRDELDICEQALELVDADPRLGFHGEAYGYLFNRPLIEEKVRRIKEMLTILGEN